MKQLLAMFSLLCLMGVVTLPLTGCKEEGPAEEAGRAIDEAGERARDAAEDLGDELGN